ncbi:sigma-70 family RNA polymerase sigma factor [uncultured Draconibacterium sp.]|uniref:RNA polymerase sigma factor n=1 Tax=uncultured Draconibacterium sp. TaxID=1573823 RepID=UPI0029C94042|nr:sigma-70 family RNA polymerase sigma factor [uncultured Draconibacterium sp.]
MKTSKNENKTKEHMVAKDFKTSVLPVSNKLLRFATHFLHDEDQARDVVQDVFLKLWQRKETLDEVENIEAFAMRMTRNRCLDVIRANKTVPIDEDTDRRLKAKTIDVHSKVELGESAEQIKMLIRQLPELQQNIMHMRDIEQLSYDEIEEATGLQRNAIRVNLSRARKKVRDEYLKMNRNDGNTRNTTITATLL